MQNPVGWCSDQFQPTHIWNPWSNETATNLEDSACTVRVLLFFPIVGQKNPSPAENWDILANKIGENGFVDSYFDLISFFFLLTQFMNSPFRELRVLQKLILQLFEWPCFVPQLFAVIPSSHAYKKNPDFMSFLSFRICTEFTIIRSCSKVK